MTSEDNPQISPSSGKDEDAKEKGFLNWPRFGGKSIWDWMQLLIIPFVLTVGGLVFSTYQHNADQQRALDQQQAAILQTYIDNIQDLLLNHNLLKSSSFDSTNPYYDVAILARARTLTALQGLDPERKGRLLIFLHEAQLIGFQDKTHVAIIDLSEADLSGADLSSADLSYADLSSANLEQANLNYAGLYSANLKDAHLEQANLSNAYLNYAYLYGVFLNNANLSNAYLIGTTLGSAVDLTQRQLDQVYSCKNAILPPGLTCHHNQ